MVGARGGPAGREAPVDLGPAWAPPPPPRPASSRPVDPLLQETAARLAAPRRFSPTAAPGPKPAGAPARRPSRRPRPSSGARRIALASSVAATAAVGGLLAYADRAPSGTEGAVGVVPATAPTAGTGTTAAGAPADGRPPPDQAPAAASPGSGGRASSSPTTATTAPATGTATGTGGNASAYADGTFTGPAESTRFGPVQVQVTTRGGKITAVQALVLPSGRKSTAINAQAAPVLESEALADQDAQLDIVSGATYTSEAYAASLQAALDQATSGTTTGQG
jgi:uncharacterized protein with FMN-binding domain